MTEKDDFFISYDSSTSKLYLSGKFLHAATMFRHELVRMLYKRTSYEEFTIEERKKERIVECVMFNCPGGSVSDTFALIRLLRMFKRELPNVTFTLYCCGCIQSAATIFMTCEVFSKVTLDRYCTIKIHNVETNFDQKTAFKKRCFDVYSDQTKQTEDIMCRQYESFASIRGKEKIDWQKIIDSGNEETCLSAQKAFEIGLCDQVL